MKAPTRYLTNLELRAQLHRARIAFGYEWAEGEGWLALFAHAMGRTGDYPNDGGTLRPRDGSIVLFF